MKNFFKKFMYSVLTVFTFLLIGAMVATKYFGVGALVFLIGSIVGVTMAIKKKSPVFNSETDESLDDISLKVEVTAQYTEPPSPKGFKIPPKPIGTVQYVGIDEAVDVHGYQLKGPLWVGPLSSREADYEPSVIDRKQPIDKSGLAEPLGYCSNYSLINNSQRNRYLEWLAGDRSEIDDLGYVFLYFYGMERYVLRCESDDRALKEIRLNEIKNEIGRLRRLFFSNKSFDSYSNQLLDVLYILHWPDRIDERKAAFPTNRPLAAHYVISKLANTDGGDKLDPDWALHWLLGFGGVSRTKTVRDQYPVLRLLFKAHYLKATDGGIKVPTCKTKLCITYKAASGGLEDLSVIQTPDTWCNPIALKRPLTKLAEINKDVMPSLRALAKAIATKDLTSILSAWPQGVPIEAVPKLKQIVERVEVLSKASSSNPIELVARQVGMSIGDKAGIGQLKTLSASLESCGFVLIPDPLVTPTVIKAGENVVTYQGTRIKELSPEGQKVALTIQLGALLALADGAIHKTELEALSKLVKSHPNSAERLYLEHYCAWRSSLRPGTAGIKKHIDQLSSHQKGDIAQFLIDLALADGELPTDEIKQLEKVFKQLGLGEEKVTEMLHRSSAIEAAPKRRDDLGMSSTGLALDANLIKAHEESTREVQKVLGSIFSDEAESDQNDQLHLTENSESDSWHRGRLDEKHDALASWLLSEDAWKMDDIKSKCSALGILVDGAIDTINNASFELYGDSLLDVGDPVEVYKDILQS